MIDQKKDDLHWLSGGGEMSKLIPKVDWSKTPLGAIESWPPSLRTTVSLCLASNFPINILWGPEGVQIYNDGYRVVCGGAHPRALGESYKVTWASAWPVVGESFERACRGETSYLENQRMFLHRNGYLEETFFTFSHSPIRDEVAGISGLFHPVTETTASMLSVRRTRALRDISNKAGGAKTVDQALQMVMQTLIDYQLDLPFVLTYLAEMQPASRPASPDGSPTHSVLNFLTKFNLAGQFGLPADSLPNTPEFIAQFQSGQHWPSVQSATIIEDVGTRFCSVPCSEYPEFVEKAMIIPLRASALDQSLGFLVVGLSTRLPLDEAYRSFLDMLNTSVTAVVNDARSYEEEKRRAEALAEIDKTKTAFFSNVSHEFRTPLTLMLGPLEVLLSRDDKVITPEVREEIEVIHRNALRLLKLVNALLDFSKIEANRMKALFVPTELHSITQDLSSAFRSAIERAGMKLIIEAEHCDNLVYVDLDMWEKIVLNLLSNAFKYTLEGEIRVSLKKGAHGVILRVADTGTGIREADLTRVFERFHRIQGAPGRTHEGTGIGLSLVQELVKIHGGSVEVESVFGQGSTFIVHIPFGKNHLPADQVRDGAINDKNRSLGSQHSESFVEEALRWLPEDNPRAPSPDLDPSDAEALPQLSKNSPHAPKKRIILADDNRDMREYVRKLLENQYEVVAVNNGRRALEAIRAQCPDLLLSDIMMPVMNGIELLKTIREDEILKVLPVVFLSARAGEEAKAGGIELGADDYLTKPFSAKELLARVQTQLHMAEIRQKATEQSTTLLHLTRQQQWMESVLDLIPTPLLLLEIESGKVMFANQVAHAMAGGVFPMNVPIMSGGETSLHNLQETAASAASGQKITDAEIVWKTPLGCFSLLIDSELVPALPEQPPRIILCLRNITRIKEIQNELKRSIGARDAFLSLASHELKTPLTVIRLQTQMTRKKISRDDPHALAPDRILKMLEQTDCQVTRLNSLVEDMLDVSLIETGKLTLHVESVDMAEILKDVVERISPQLALAKTEVRIKPLPSAVGRWDRFRIEQVLINLLTNAARYGNGKQVEVGLSVENREVRVWVCDQGKGIAQKDQDRIFGRFERAVSPNEVTGLGLGLYIARQIVERHEGSIQVKSEAGQGATFIITLPLNPDLLPEAAGNGPVFS